MEAIYVGGGQLHVGADLENGIYGATEDDVSQDALPAIDFPYVAAMVKGREGNHFAVKAGNAQNGSLSTIYDGPRPSGGGKDYTPMKKQGEFKRWLV